VIAPEGFKLSTAIAYPAGLIVTALSLVMFIRKKL